MYILIEVCIAEIVSYCPVNIVPEAQDNRVATRVQLRELVTICSAFIRPNPK